MKKLWFPFSGKPKVAARNAKLRKLMRAGIIKPMSKQQMRDLIQQHIDPNIIYPNKPD